MPQISRAYAVGRVRSLERNLLSQASLERLCQAAGVSELARTLSEIGWGDAQDQAGVERLADEHVAKACALVRECTTDINITDCYLIKFDILNLKTLIKARLLGEEEPRLSGNGTLMVEKLRHAVAEGSYIFLPSEYQDALKQIDARCAVQVDPMWIDARLDKLMYELIFDKLSKVKALERDVKEYFVAMADATNIMIALRASKMGRDADFAAPLFVTGGRLATDALKAAVEDNSRLISDTRYMPYADFIKRGIERLEQSEGLAAIEKLLADYQTSVLRARRYDITSILPLIGYLVAREREAAAVRLIVTAKAVGASDEALARRLRELYA